MRVIAGSAKGRGLKTLAGKNTRPTTDKVKEAIFNILTPYLQGGTVLDLYAGTGGLSIEALSRGMSYAVLVDHNRQSLEIIKENLVSCGFSEVAEVYKNDAERALKALAKRGIKFDLVFLDPPYRRVNYQQLLEKFRQFELVKSQGIIVVEHDANELLAEMADSYSVIKRVSYGQIGLTVYKAVNTVN